MVGVILAGGNGVRLKQSTGEDCCKVLTRLNEKYLIEFALENLVALGVRKVIIVVGAQGGLVCDAIGTHYKGLHISYVVQPVQKGLINALSYAVDKIDGDIILQLADEVFKGFDTEKVKEIINDLTDDFYCGITYEEDSQKIKNNFSVETLDGVVMKSCTEKPREVTDNIKGTGFCIFQKDCLNILKDVYDESSNTPDTLCDFMNLLISREKRGSIFPIAQKEFNINTFTDLKEAESSFR